MLAQMVKKKQPLPPLSEQIRQAIDESSLSRYQISKEAEIDESALAKFYHGHRGLSLANLDKLGLVLGLRIVIEKGN